MPRKDKEAKREYDREYQRQRRQGTKASEHRKPFAFVTNKGRMVRADVLEQYAVKNTGEQSKQLTGDRFAGNYGKLGLMEPLYTPEALSNLLELNTYHARCCLTKARDVAGLGWDLKPLVDNPSEAIKTEMDEFFSRPGIGGKAETLVTTLNKHALDYEVLGYAALEVVRQNDLPTGKITGLYHVPAHTLRIHRSFNKFAQIRAGKRIWFKAIEHDMDVHRETGDEHPLGSLAPENRASELIWNCGYTPRSDYYGLPEYIPAIGAIHGDIARRDYNIAFFDNYGVPAFAVYITGDFDEGEKDEDGFTELERAIQEHFKELPKHPHSTLVLTIPSNPPTGPGMSAGEVKVEMKPLATDVKDASFRLYRKDNRDEVISAHATPPYRIGIAETGSLGGSTAKESTEIYKNSVIRPRQEVVETLLNQHIVWSETGFATGDWEFKFREIDTADEAHDVEVLAKLFLVGAATPNNIIQHFGERFGLEPSDHPAMNAHYVGGRAIDLPAGAETSGEVIAVMQSLSEKLLKVAMKNDTGDDTGDRAAYTLAASLQGLNGMGTSRGGSTG
jgi:PBSX family phage portal protein